MVSLAREAEFSFSKNHRDLKIIFFLKICKYLLFTSRTIVKKKIQLTNFNNLIFRPPQWTKLFLTWSNEIF